MNKQLIWKVTVQTSAEAEDAVAAMLEATTGVLTATYTHLETGHVEVSAYLAQQPNRARTRAELQTALRVLETNGVQTSPGRITVAQVPAENWAESWKRHFKPLEIGSKLLVKPPWSKRNIKKGMVAVVLEPGLSFGTGQHPTTAFCLQELVEYRRPGKSQSFLDLGTGSGILAISAARLGYKPIAALDVDEEAIRVARANTRLNHVQGRISFEWRDLKSLRGRPQETFSVVCANLVANLLIDERKTILAYLKPGGILVLAGILAAEFELVAEAYRKGGLRLERSRTDGEWRSGTWVHD